MVTEVRSPVIAPPVRFRRRRQWDALIVAILVIGMCGSNCSHPPDRKYTLEKFPKCRDSEPELEPAVESARESVETWIEFEAIAEAGPADVGAAAVQSYPQAQGALGETSYLYDNALGLLWYAWTGARSRADRLAALLIDRQREDGSWPFRFDLSETDGTSKTVRSGAVAWAAYALAYYRETGGRGPASEAAERAADFLWARRRPDEAGPAGGLVGAGYRVEAGEEQPPVRFAAAEHQFDAHALLAELAPRRADELEQSIVDRLWLEDAGRFAMGADASDVDRRRALDAAGAWGAMWLASVGREDAARESLAVVLDDFPTREGELDGYRPYLDRVGSYRPRNHGAHVFVEGTMSVAVAALRLEELETARRLLRAGVQLQCMTGAGLPYSNLAADDFATTPAAGPSFWFLFATREWESGESAPVFRRFRPAEGGGVR